MKKSEKTIAELNKLKIKKLRREGMSCAKIAEEIGCSVSTIYFHFNPGKINKNIDHSKYNEKTLIRVRRFRAKKKAEKEKENKGKL